MSADLSILTLSRNPDHFMGLHDALQRCRAPELPVERILVNNAGRGVTGRMLTKLALERGWLVVEPGVNTSFSHGNNLAARAASGHWFLLLNDDARPEPDALVRLVERRHEASVVGALLLHSDGTVNHAGGRLVGVQQDHIGRNAPREQFERREVPLVAWSNLALALVNAETFRDLGGMDERYYYGCEDVDYCYRVLRAGGSIRVALDVVAVHDECGTRPRGGAADVINLRTLASSWHSQLPIIIRNYRARVAPERLWEGE